MAEFSIEYICLVLQIVFTATQQDADSAEKATAEYVDCITWPVILNPDKTSG